MPTKTVVECPSCDAKMKISAVGANGKRVRCPKCGEVVTVDAKVAAQEPKPRVVSLAEKPAKRRKKTGSKGLSFASNGPMLAILLFVGLAVVVGGAVSAAILLRSGGSGAKTEAEFVKYASPEGYFVCEYPSNWSGEGGGKTHFYWFRASKGSAKFFCKQSLLTANTVIHGGMGIGSGDGPDAPVHHLHLLKKEVVESDFEEYSEQPPEVLEIGLGAARRSMFTASTTFGGKLQGYRVTIAGEGPYEALCHCSASDWPKFQAQFDRMLKSLSIGERKDDLFDGVMVDEGAMEDDPDEPRPAEKGAEVVDP